MDTIPQDTPLKQCKGECQQFLPATATYFYKSSVNTDGLMSLCIACRSIYMSNRYARQHPKPEKPTPPPGHKFCIKCGNPKLINEKNFKPNKVNGRDGFYHVCRECANKHDTERTHKRYQEAPPSFDETVLKKCTSCPNSFPAIPRYFDRNKRKSDGLSSECKQCKKARSKEYNLKYPDEIQWRKFMYKEANRECIREQGRAYIRAHRAEHNARFRERYGQVKQNGG